MSRMSRVLSAVLVSLTATSTVAELPAVHEFRLDNGLRLLVKEDHRAPVAVSQVWYRVGSSYEHEGITGISHFLEHMMFKGTEQHPGNSFSRLIAEAGGRENAFTGSDYTAYYQQLAQGQLELSFLLEADRMRGLLLEEEELRRELEVIKEERRSRVEDAPRSYTHEVLRSAAFQVSPYRHPVLGWMQDIEHTTVENLRDWYRRWYAPGNALVVVTGDVQPEEVLELARKHFGPLPARREQLRPPAAVEPEQHGPKRLTVRRPAELPYLVITYKAPTLVTARAAGGGEQAEQEVFALEVLAGILSGGDSARLPERLERGLAVAASAGAWYDPYDRLETLFSFSATPAPGHDTADLEAALRGEIERLREEPVTVEELDRVKAQVVANHVYERDSLFYQAMQIGLLETVGLPWQEAEQYPRRIQAVTAEQVQEAARKYLLDDRLTMAELQPLPLEQAHQPPPPGAGHGGPGRTVH